jgi:hypothetical protein
VSRRLVRVQARKGSVTRQSSVIPAKSFRHHYERTPTSRCGWGVLRRPHEASAHAQIIAVSQSADLLDSDNLDASVVRAVTMEEGLTTISKLTPPVATTRISVRQR